MATKPDSRLVVTEGRPHTNAPVMRADNVHDSLREPRVKPRIVDDAWPGCFPLSTVKYKVKSDPWLSSRPPSLPWPSPQNPLSDPAARSSLPALRGPRPRLFDHHLSQKVRLSLTFISGSVLVSSLAATRSTHLLDATQHAHLPLEILFRYPEQLLPHQGLQLIPAWRAV